MITKIQIANEASYATDGVTIQPKAINHLFGANGTGKTTISRIIANPEIPNDCAVEWSNNQPLDVFVYNRDFIEDSFASQMNGVFTLGATEKDMLEKLQVKSGARSNTKSDIAGLNHTLFQKKEELRKKQEQLSEACWVQKTKFEDEFRVALKGSINSKANFREKVLTEDRTNESQLQPLETLEQKATALFANTVEKVPTISTLNFSELQQILSNPIWQKIVVGSADIEIATLINKLDNSDWVGQGRMYLDHSNDTCPFCQQGLPHDFKNQLEQYFGGQFAEDTNLINTLIDDYTVQRQQILTPMEGLSDKQLSFIEGTLEGVIENFQRLLEENHRLFQQKSNEPSQKIDPKDINEECGKITQFISNANQRIAEHNTRIDNAEAEKRILTKEVWRFILGELKQPLASYKSEVSDLNTAITNLSSRIESKQTQLSLLNDEIAELERDTVSVQPTIDAINKTLSDYGFTGFRLAIDTDQEDKYRLLRNGNVDEKLHQTLSEGERSFVTFLYFYHLISGSLSSSGTLTDRVVVFDDPVSSLDSSILFVVSSLVRKVISDVSGNTGQIKQIFVLTHNVFFHRQVSFSSKFQEKKDKREFWLIRKPEGKTSINSFGQKDPIKTAYGLLWEELKQEQPSATALPNAMRRILEYYFKILGGYNFDKLVEAFEGNEKPIVQSLISWAHTNSHSEIEDADYVLGDIEIETQRSLFKAIFDKTGNIAHYNMMMDADVSDYQGD